MTGYITSLRNNPAVEFGCPRCGELHEHIRGAVECCAITTELRESMIAQALAKHSFISTCSGRGDMTTFTVERTYLVVDTVVETVSVEAESSEEAETKALNGDFSYIIGVETYDGQDSVGDVTAEVVR